jgi:hypothetical protein
LESLAIPRPSRNSPEREALEGVHRRSRNPDEREAFEKLSPNGLALGSEAVFGVLLLI